MTTDRAPRTMLGIVVFAVYVVALLLVAFWPVHVDRDMGGFLSELVQWSRAHGMPWMGYGLIEFSANVLWFVPLGLLSTVFLGAERWWVAVLIGLGSSVLIELGQAVFLAGRTASALDVAANTIGTLLGALVVLLVARVRRSPVAVDA